jgi:hypothetical protein
MAIGLEHRPQNTSANATRLKSPVRSIRRPSSLSEGILIGPPDHQVQGTFQPVRHQIMATMTIFYHNGFMALVVRITCLWLVSVQKLDITCGGSFYSTRAAGRHLAPRKGAVNQIEPPWGQRVGDAAHGRRRERHHIGIAPKE